MACSSSLQTSHSHPLPKEPWQDGHTSRHATGTCICVRSRLTKYVEPSAPSKGDPLAYFLREAEHGCCQIFWGMRRLLRLKYGRAHNRAHGPAFCLEWRSLLLQSKVLPVVETTLKQSLSQISDFIYPLVKVHIYNKSSRRQWKRRHIFLTRSCTLIYFNLYYSSFITNQLWNTQFFLPCVVKLAKVGHCLHFIIPSFHKYA